MALDPTKNPNMAFLHRLSKDNPIRILLSKKPTDQEAQQVVKKAQNQHGLIQPDRRKKIRRPLQLQGIEFYDLGLLANGTTLPFNIKPTMNITYFPITNSVSFTHDDFTLAHWGQLYDAIMDEAGNDPLNLVSTYTKMEGPEHGIIAYQGRGAILIDGDDLSQTNRLYNSGSDVDKDNPEWKDGKKQLKSISQDLEFVNYGGASYYFNTQSSNYRVTESMDYSDPDLGVASLNMKKGTRIFLVPQIGNLRMSQQAGAGADFRRAYLFGHWAIRPREIFLTKTLEKFSETVPIFEGYPFNFPIKSTDPEMLNIDYMSDGYVTALADYIKTLPEAELYVQRHDSSVSRTFGFESLSNFPFTFAGGPQDYLQVMYTDLREENTVIYGTFGGWGSDDGNIYYGAGMLMAIIQQGNTFRYIWWQSGSNFPSTWSGIGIDSTPE